MPFTVTMPKLSPTMEGGRIVKWHKNEGDLVKADEVLIEVATDKATVEYNALDEGYLRQIVVGEGSDAKVNQPIAVFTETADESLEGYSVAQEEEKAPAPVEEATEESVPQPAASTAVPAKSFMTFAPEPALDGYTFEWDTQPKEGRIAASPLAKKLAKEKGIDLASIKGSGPNGRVVSRDLDLGLPDLPVSFGPGERPKHAAGSFEEEVPSPMRKAIGDRLQASKSTIPHFYVHQEVEVTSLVDIRKQLKDSGFKITINDFLVRAAALALKVHPGINTGYNSQNDTVIRFKTIDIAVAVTIDEGLITPIIRQTDYKNLGQIASEIRALAKCAKEGTLAPEQYRGGSFTISNLGMFGITAFQAVINPPQAAILSVGGIKETPVIKEGEIVPGKVMTLSLASDHRVIDGALAAAYLKTLKQYLEVPALLLV